MIINIYWTGLFVLVPLVALVISYQAIIRLLQPRNSEKVTNTHDTDAKEFRDTFLRVYLVVMGSEWIQGPYMYSLFRDEKGLDERTVAALYITMYTSAAISALFTGYMADRFGRRAACLVFCGIHSLASLSVMFDAVEILIAGRILGGIGLNLLWTAFESWMVTEYNTRVLDRNLFPLSAMFGIMTKYNCLTAILAGVLAHCVVLALGSKADLFICGMALDAGAAALILRTWNENKGVNVTRGLSTCQDDLASDTAEEIPSEKATTTLKDMRIWALSFASCCFEGTIFIFTFFWPETLQEAHDNQHPGDGDGIPYGVIFATFMAAMVLGAILFSLFTRNSTMATTKHDSGFGAIMPTLLLGTTLFLSALSFLIAGLAKGELHLFLAFLLLESCNGVYVPSMAYYRSMIVNDSSRALIYGLMNFPLFIFVVVALCTTSSNGVSHRHIVFLFSAVLLLVAAVAVTLGLGILTIRQDFLRVSSRDTDDIDSIEKGGLDIPSVNQGSIAFIEPA
ncbi:MFS general substrate transporter [Hypoxylon crocopeplum]|nr:MFS general substrate transporter [Hypoxylon crocopeplum]